MPTLSALAWILEAAVSAVSLTLAMKPEIFLCVSGEEDKVRYFWYSDWLISPWDSRVPGDMVEYSSDSSCTMSASMSKKSTWLS
uniref:Putative secreted protein n=1 Tax=Ixodes ricinus TaxID=34613 RepID=A0A6B0U8A1_IXORI